jgi:hypothetical protein
VDLDTVISGNYPKDPSTDSRGEKTERAILSISGILSEDVQTDETIDCTSQKKQEKIKIYFKDHIFNLASVIVC